VKYVLRQQSFQRADAGTLVHDNASYQASASILRNHPTKLGTLHLAQLADLALLFSTAPAKGEYISSGESLRRDILQSPHKNVGNYTSASVAVRAASLATTPQSAGHSTKAILLE
jgi:hypothetical protein